MALTVLILFYFIYIKHKLNYYVLLHDLIIYLSFLTYIYFCDFFIDRSPQCFGKGGLHNYAHRLLENTCKTGPNMSALWHYCFLYWYLLICNSDKHLVPRFGCIFFGRWFCHRLPQQVWGWRRRTAEKQAIKFG